MRERISHPGRFLPAGRWRSAEAIHEASATRPTDGGGGGREMFRPVALGLCIASCKVTAVKFSAPPLNFSGIPIYSAARYLYLFRASSLSLPLCPPFLPRPNVSRGGSLLSSIPFLARTSLPARTHAHAPLSVLPVSLPLPSPSVSPFLSG